MQSTIRETKAALRSQVCAVVRSIPLADRVAASAQARALLAEQERWKHARSVLLFAPMAEEVDIWPLLAEALSAGKQVALPRFVARTRTYEVCQIHEPGADIQIGHFGIREPASHCPSLVSNHLDLILVPGVAFDLCGRRLGRGKGYYDHLLAALRGTTCAVAFDQQLVDAIPVEPHDVCLNCILTPTRWLELNA